MRTAALLFALGISSACVTQRSVNLGQMASAVGKGAADINVFTGVMYQSQTHPAVNSGTSADPVSNQITSNGLSLPWFEANANYGFGDHLGLNLHMSPAGIQPGLKITLNKSRIANIALLPQVGIGYFTYSDSTVTTQANGTGTLVNPTFSSSLIFTAGLKILISHSAGFYCGLGYDLMVTRTNTLSTPGNPQTSVSTGTSTLAIQHQLAAALGWSIKVGFVSIRPEIGFAVAPAISGTQTTQVGSGNPTSYSAGGGFSWAILPGFGFALTSPPDHSDKGGDEDEKNVGETEERQEEKAEDPPPKREDEQ